MENPMKKALLIGLTLTFAALALGGCSCMDWGHCPEIFPKAG
jgi:hypothetical protein